MAVPNKKLILYELNEVPIKLIELYSEIRPQSNISYLLKKGNILNIASIYGKIQPKFEIYEKTSINPPTVYGPIKSAQIMIINYFSKIFAYRKNNIRCNTISPGGVFGGQSKIFLNNYKSYCKNKGMISPSDLVGVANFLISDDSSYITGQDIQIDDGFSL